MSKWDSLSSSGIPLLVEIEDVKVLVVCDGLRVHDDERVLDLLVVVDPRVRLLLEHLLADLVQVSQSLVINHAVVPVPGVFEEAVLRRRLEEVE